MERQSGQTCVADRNCDAGLHCETCVADGNVRPRCTRVQPINPASQVKGLPFNRYSWLTTHNSFALMGHKNALGVLPITPTNQQDSITSQLQVMPLSRLSLSLLSAILSFTAPDLVAGMKAHNDENIPPQCKHWPLL